MTLREYAAQQPQEPQKTQQSTSLLSRTQAEQAEAAQRAAAVYAEYQQNIKAVCLLEADILKGLQNNSEITGLFLKALKAMSLTTHNDLFYSQAAERLKNNYGITTTTE